MRRTTIILDGDTERAVDSRQQSADDNRSATVRMMLDRYSGLCAVLGRSLREKFSREELQALADSCNSWASRMEPAELLLGELRAGDRRLSVLEAQIEDGIHMENLAERHGVDALALLDKLHSLHPAETLALLDAIERWWNAEERPEYPQL